MSSDRRRVLMISWDYYPHTGIGAHRAGKFVKYLREFGWEPVVLTTSVKNYPYIAENLYGQIPEGVKVIRAFDFTIRTLVRMARERLRDNSSKSGRISGCTARENTLKKVLWWFEEPIAAGWIPLGFLRGLRAAYSSDVIWASSPPAAGACLGALLSSFTGRPFVVDLRDPWRVEEILPYPARLYRKIDEMWERYVFRKALRIVGVTPEMQQMYQQRYPDCADKITAIYNGYDHEDFERLPVRTSSTVGGLKIGYFGTLISGYEPYIARFFEAAGGLEEPRPKVYFRGHRPDIFTGLAVTAGAIGLTDIGGVIPYREALAMMCEMDVLLLIGCSGFLKIVPGKLFEYIGARKPIFAVTPEGALSAFIRRHQIGVSVEGTTAEQIRKGLEEMHREYGLYAEKVRELAPQCTRRRRTSQLADILNEAAG